MEVIDDFLCTSLWGPSNHDFSYSSSVGASGGLVTIWDRLEVEVWLTIRGAHFLMIHGRFIKFNEDFYIFNVYAPCNRSAKQKLWNLLSSRLLSLCNNKVCVCGDFNTVRSVEERRSVRGSQVVDDCTPFNDFIEDRVLIDLLLSGRKFTWFKGDGRSMRRLDRFLLSVEWCMVWPNCIQVAQLRGLSDHCPILLSVDEENWGPRPVSGWGGHVLKEKLKLMKQSRLNWLRDGDANSKFFHSVLAARRRLNSLSSILVDGVVVEGVQPFRQAVFTHFKNHFLDPRLERPGVGHLQFRKLSYLERGGLTKPFSEDEIKAAVWDCDSFKSPGPDGINLGFFKSFWPEIKTDLVRFVTEFHRNGKLAKGINSTFIALIPKVASPQSLNEFRPISLVGSMYKILAKILANRLRQVVDEARKLKKYLLLFKVDFAKAYDSVDWGYLDEVMGSMSFPVVWRKWIKECVGTATASVLVNGSPTDEFHLERGLRQALVDAGMFTGYRVGRADSVVVSHLQFADDTLLIGNKSWANVRALRAGLVMFEAMSGLKVNFHKSSLEYVLVRVDLGGEALRWRRRLWAREEELVEECRALLLTVSLQESVTDRWLWVPNHDDGYSVPLKVSILAWRLLRDRLPTKSNLANRGILALEARLCVSGCGNVEDVNHLFLSCVTFSALWPMVRAWLGVVGSRFSFNV
ncbi:uncharacterized protein [Medicago truncatula]|uniref:uncharacterized protein n=1 Tax=Medicago truncatula TaxID=3880 RepID=UPI000D2F16B8|nr:uncharacterized protein LOC112422108 [Medicago truncatula]